VIYNGVMKEAGKYHEKTEQEIGLLMLGGGEDDVWK
jgi:hypothetical protein